MKIVIDNQIARMLALNNPKIAKDPFLSHPHNHIHLRWPTLLEYLGLGSVLSNLPPFDEVHPLIVASISTLCANKEKEVLCYVYDRLFTENLNQIRAIPQLNATFLHQAIKDKQESTSYLELGKILSPALGENENAFASNASHTMHDLILYLAWDRMCVCMSTLFNYQSTDPQYIEGIAVLKDCLLESFQHISQQGRTFPGIYRMLESLFYYQLREENLHKHSVEAWALLCQSFPILKNQNELADFFYLDDAVVSMKKLKTGGENQESYVTLDSPEFVNARVALANFLMNKLRIENPDWNCVFHPKKIDFLSLD